MILFLGTLAYTLVTFPIAVIWHIVFFKSLYLSFGYFGEEPSFILGFCAIVLQGGLLTWGFTKVSFSGSVLVQALKYVSWLGVFFWTSHVIALMAKSVSAQSMVFFLMETFYLGLQFGIYGLLLAAIHNKFSPQGQLK